MSTPLHNLAKESPSRLEWIEDEDAGQRHEPTKTLKRKLEEFTEDTGPGHYYKTLLPIRPNVFFTYSQAPFHCKELLPCWAQTRCIHIFGLLSLANDSSSSSRRRQLDDFPSPSELFVTRKAPDCSPHVRLGPPHLREEGKEANSKYVRGAIQLRPFLEQLHRKQGGRMLTGEHITVYATSTKEIGCTIGWTEDWRFSNSIKPTIADVETREANDLFSVYKAWLQDPELADKVAHAYNNGNNQRREGNPYPFCHSEYPGQLYFETSLCRSREGKVWLDRPLHRGCYSHLNVEGRPKRKYFFPRHTQTSHHLLRNFPSYRPSM